MANICVDLYIYISIINHSRGKVSLLTRHENEGVIAERLREKVRGRLITLWHASVTQLQQNLPGLSFSY